MSLRGKSGIRRIRHNVSLHPQRFKEVRGVTMQSHDIRRHRDGAIDFDFYRAQAAALRSQAMREAFKFKATFKSY